MYLIAVLSLLSYLLGSFSAAFWFGKWFGHIDVRQFGSKNAGATNIYRALGPKIGISVFIIDIMKSYIAVQLIHFIPNIVSSSEQYLQIKILFGVCAVIGHIFPLYSDFKGGRGVASLFGLFLGLNPLIGAITLVFYISIILLFRVASIASICTSIFYPLLIQASFLYTSHRSYTLTIFSILVCPFVIFTHRENIKRLMKGEEKKLF